MEKKPTSVCRINFQDCDPFGHLNNAAYINYLLNARGDHLREYYDLDIYQHTQKSGNAWIVSKNKIAYLKPAKFNESVLIESELLYSDKMRVMAQCIMFSEEKDSIHAVLWAEFIYVDINTSRPKRHEPEIQALLDNLLVSIDDRKKLDDFNFDDSLKQTVKEFKSLK
ncbi:MAG: acyl-CoA thioesterase [Spirochaetia bacterium]|nr:acyl-CoA thioesterase [Spirochaetia bacterium]